MAKKKNQEEEFISMADAIRDLAKERGISEEEKARRAYDEDNLVALCRDCHIKRHHPEGTIQDKLLKYSD